MSVFNYKFFNWLNEPVKKGELLGTMQGFKGYNYFMQDTSNMIYCNNAVVQMKFVDDLKKLRSNDG